MRRQGSSTTFTVYFDGQFWVGIIERFDENTLYAAQVVFGPEPSDEEVFRFVLDKWNDLRFSPAVDAKQPKKADNPKHRQREAAKTAAEPKPSTKAQAAIAEMREHQKAEARKRKSDTKRANEETKFAARQAKRKQKHRGH